MKKNIYCVRDDLAEVFQDMFCSINDSTAKRDFINGVSQTEHKNDLTLYFLGYYDNHSGMITMDTNPRRIMSGLEVNTAGNMASVSDDDNKTEAA